MSVTGSTISVKEARSKRSSKSSHFELEREGSLNLSVAGGELATPSTSQRWNAQKLEGDKTRSMSATASVTADKLERGESFEDAPLPRLHYFPWWSKWIAALVLFVSGVFSTYSFKMENKTIAPRCGDASDPDCAPAEFLGACLQTFIMFVGETLCLVIWYTDSWINTRRGKVPWSDFTVDHSSFVKPPGSWWHWVIPAICDCISTTCSNFALTLIYASTEQMMHNFVIVLEALMQLAFLRRALRVHEWVGTTSITIAMILAAIPAVQTPEESSVNDGSRAWVGILLELVGTAVQAFQTIFEEYLFERWRYSPIKAVGVEGVAGLVLSGITIPISQATGLEDVKTSFYQYGHSPRLGVISGLYLVACILFNGSGLLTTKFGGGLLRLIVTAVRAPMIWILDLSLGWITYDNYNLSSVFVFLIGFAVHVRMYPAESFPQLHHFLSRPVHFCCTKPELDEVDWLLEKEAAERKNAESAAASPEPSPV
eukprot:Gregarina_sp_Pseudo_9__5@NODE_1003_length_1980_cov_158_620299_g940_i0_p1_GENE_NODE_1003_length_1980_cov_158_620299_g940_i0NODE_1003_length_1980_cov_158_620299_g940_i0_p1_ORF_typecomplete_len485_score49_82CRTlike/PF08627_10/1_8e24Nuc_sug_transp/PF04142_15/2_7e24SLC35F/PF06027_12/4_6e02SLC35F/PF06027_12/1_5e22UAA/PF08449_11/2_6e02UAA/PF08449_11/1_2e14TPT/PF03151_16/4_6e13PUNUT/PF16913_5/0_00014EamA/PF00892_20/1_8e03EamA/PF00892_20/0_0002EamA/PF00892_20/87Mg_trans_NIPA/PF05653_14/4e03Mg_trans_NIPA/